MDTYGFVDEKEGHFYGVYSEILGQVDSRAVSDERILKSIELMLSLGKPVKRSELNHGADLKRTYYFIKRFLDTRATTPVSKYL